VPAGPPAEVQRGLDKAFAAFFRRVKAGQKAGYPRFRSVDRFDTVEWPRGGDGCRWRPEAARVYLQGIGHVDVPARPLPPAGREIGLDVGIARFATTSDGEVIASPRFLRKSEAELAVAQQALAGKRKGSANRRRAKAKVAGVHRRIRDRRADFHHKTARALVSSCDAIAIEDLSITAMSRRPAPRPDPAVPGAWLPNRAAAKGGLNKSILDAGWGQFTGILAAKAEEAGRRVVRVDPQHQHHLPPVRREVRPPPAGHRDLPALRADGRRRQRRPQHLRQGRAGPWSGRSRSLRS
jgi:putative transposase